jgi:hypothetical protein
MATRSIQDHKCWQGVTCASGAHLRLFGFSPSSMWWTPVVFPARVRSDVLAEVCMFLCLLLSVYSRFDFALCHVMAAGNFLRRKAARNFPRPKFVRRNLR